MNYHTIQSCGSGGGQFIKLLPQIQMELKHIYLQQFKQKIIILNTKEKNKMKYILILLLLFHSCSTNVFKFNTTDYALIGKEKFIQAQYHYTKELHEKSSVQLSIKNTSDSIIYVFSTVLENTQMLYSSKNFNERKGIVKLNSYYENYMSDAHYSGVKKFNFIPIIRDSCLLINIDKLRFNNANEIEFTYYFIPDLDESPLINIDKYKIIRKTIRKKL